MSGPQFERRPQGQDQRSLQAQEIPPSSASATLPAATAAAKASNPSPPKLGWANSALPRAAITPKASTDALAAVNLLPLPHHKPGTPSKHKPSTPSTRQFSPTNAASITPLPGETSTGTPRADGNIANDQTYSKQESTSPSKRSQQQQQQHQHNQQSSNDPMSSQSNDNTGSSSNALDLELPEARGGIKRPTIEIIEKVNPERAPTEIMMANDDQAAGNASNISTNGSVVDSCTATEPANESNNSGISRNGRPQQFRMKSRPKLKKIFTSPTQQSEGVVKKHGGIWRQGKFDTRGSSLAENFTWEEYLQRVPCKVAPKEAFRQAQTYPKNLFTLGMKLEARDPRNSNNWSLASVVGIEGLHLRLRFDGTDHMNDLYELVDSLNIRPYGSDPNELLLAPMGYIHNIGGYLKFVEKTMKNSIIASPDCFPPQPEKPPKNLFKVGMKLEAVDRKNRDLICPATIGDVQGDNVKIIFDGWSDAFNYTCEYYSRDLFPINWCRDVGRSLQAPKDYLLQLEERGSAAKEASLFSSLPPTESLFSNESSSTCDSNSLISGRPTESSSESASTETSALSSGLLKRRRGRPRKDEEGDIKKGTANEKVEGRGTGTGSGRGRGRASGPRSTKGRSFTSVSPKAKSSDTPASERSSSNSVQLSESALASFKKPIGRPRKNSNNDETNSPSQATSIGAKQNLCSTPKKNTSGDNSIMPVPNGNTQLESYFHATADDVDEDLSEQVFIEGYQCQRSVPYPECLKSKSTKQMPPNISKPRAASSDYHQLNRSSSNISESQPNASSDFQVEGHEQPSDSKLIEFDQPSQSSYFFTTRRSSSNSPSYSLASTDHQPIAYEQPPDSEPIGFGGPMSDQYGSEQANQTKKLKTDAPTKIYPSSEHPTSWSVDDVLDLIRTEETLVKYSDVFKTNEIDGKAFMLLTTDVLVNHMGLKIGPVLKINDLLEQVKRHFGI